MYKIASRNQQARAESINLAALASASPPEYQTADERRENLRRAIKALEPQILAAPKNSETRKMLGQRKHELIEEMRRLGPGRKKHEQLTDFIIKEVKQILPLAQWRAIVARAERAKLEYDAAEAAKEPTP